MPLYLVLKRIEIELFNLTLYYRVFMSLDDDFKVVYDCKIIPQADLNILFTRNLSASWYDGVTPVTIQGRLEGLEVKETIFSILV